MALIVKNSKNLIAPEKFKLKVLVYGLPGTGKTEWATTAPNVGVAACETGQGSGLLTAASKGVDYVEPSTYQDFVDIADGKVFTDKDTIVLDSLTSMANTFIKEETLKIPRTGGNSPKRQKGVPELDDYGVMAELTRKVLNKLLSPNFDKHVIVTATEKYKDPDAEAGRYESLTGPDLPGQMFLGSTAMFDFVFRLRTRPVLRVPGDAKSRYSQRYFITAPDGQGTLAKCRSVVTGKPLLDAQEIFDLDSGVGTFPYMLEKILKGYGEAKK